MPTALQQMRDKHDRTARIKSRVIEDIKKRCEGEGPVPLAIDILNIIHEALYEPDVE